MQYYIKPLRMMDENDHPLLTNDEMKVIFNQVLYPPFFFLKKI